MAVSAMPFCTVNLPGERTKAPDLDEAEMESLNPFSEKPRGQMDQEGHRNKNSHKNSVTGQATADAAELHRLLANYADGGPKHRRPSIEEPPKMPPVRRLSIDYIKERRVSIAEEKIRRKSVDEEIRQNDASMIAILCDRSSAERQEIIEIYNNAYGGDLIHELCHALSGEFGELINTLMLTPMRCDARQLRYAINSTSTFTGLSTKNSAMIEVLCTRTNQQLRKIEHEYRQAYGRYLAFDLTQVTWNHLMHLFMYLSASARDESDKIDVQMAKEDAAALCAADDQHFGRQSSLFIVMLSMQNYAQLRALFAEYKLIAGADIAKAVEREFSGHFCDGLLAVIASVNNTLPTYFAHRLHHTLHSMTSHYHDTSLIHLIVTRSEIDMYLIREEYLRLYDKTLETDISEYCSGSYRTGLLTLVCKGDK